MANYSKKDIIQALKYLGIKQGDNLFCHSNIGFFGQLENATTSNDYYKIFKDAVFDVIGEKGTFICPTFSYSFCKNEEFDVQSTAGVCGVFSELMRADKNSYRSEDANFSIVAIGENAEYFTKDVSKYSFGVNSFWDKFLKSDGIFCNFNFDSASTFIHYVEKQLKVPYRWDKGFEGYIINNQKKEKRIFYHFVCNIDNENHSADFTKFDEKAKILGVSNVANVGKGQILKISAKETYKLIEDELEITPNFLIKGNL